MNLQAELAALSQKIESEMPDIHQSFESIIRGLRKADMVSRGPKAGENITDFALKNIYYGKELGENIRDFSLPNPWGEQIKLSSLLAKGPVVLNFYRGNWCPFCSMELRALIEISPQIKELGANLVAISLERPEESEKTLDMIQNQFIVLSDIDAVVSKQFKLVFEAPNYNKASKLNNFDLAAFNNSDRGLLVVPASYVIDQNATIRFAFADEDFRRRVDPQKILESLKEIQKK